MHSFSGCAALRARRSANPWRSASCWWFSPSRSNISRSSKSRRGTTRAAAIAANVPADCDSFLYTRYHPNLARRHPRIHDRDHQTQQVDAMWAAIAAEKPTFNGYSGYAPTGWPLWPVILVSEQELGYQRRELEEWIDRHDLGDETVCWVVLRFRIDQVASARVERIGPSRP
ncbi:MAG: hypothetical protein R2862_12145 [Thermoanaerobaculia bacterium]